MPIIFDLSKPLTKLRGIAAELGWNGLELWRQDLDDHAPIY